jgi:hypothetical protein
MIQEIGTIGLRVVALWVVWDDNARWTAVLVTINTVASDQRTSGVAP